MTAWRVESLIRGRRDRRDHRSLRVVGRRPGRESSRRARRFDLEGLIFPEWSFEPAIDSHRTPDAEPPHALNSRGLEQIDEAEHVDPKILSGRERGKARHRQVNDAVHIVFPDERQAIKRARRVQAFHDYPLAKFILQKARLAPRPEPRDDDIFPRVQKFPGRMKTDKSHASGNQNHLPPLDEFDEHDELDE